MIVLRGSLRGRLKEWELIDRTKTVSANYNNPRNPAKLFSTLGKFGEDQQCENSNSRAGASNSLVLLYDLKRRPPRPF